MRCMACHRLHATSHKGSPGSAGQFGFWWCLLYWTELNVSTICWGAVNNRVAQ